MALGCYGLSPLKSYIGRVDRNGRRMAVTQEAVADELASAASLLMGQGDEGVPAVVIRGYRVPSAGGEEGSAPLRRAPEREVFLPAGD